METEASSWKNFHLAYSTSIIFMLLALKQFCLTATPNNFKELMNLNFSLSLSTWPRTQRSACL